MTRPLLSIALLLALAACGKREDLRPADGAAMPPKPAMARDVPTTDELLTPGPEARPERSSEQVKRSQPRPEDPFDLPPAR